MNFSDEKSADEPSVPCPKPIKSPFLAAANALNLRYDELANTLQKVEELISQREVKALQQTGEVLIREAKSRAHNRTKDYVINDSYFRFTTDDTFRHGWETQREPTWHTVPFLGDVTDEDAAFYSVITGKNKAPVPLRIAQAIVDPKFDWRFSISQIRKIGNPIPSAPETAVEIPTIHVDNERRLVAGGQVSNLGTELDVNWRKRGQRICDAVREFSEDTSWSKKTIAADLVRFGDKYIWLSLEAPSEAALLCPGLIQLKDHLVEVAECLKLWRSDLGTPNDSSARLKRWIESKTGAAPWIAHISEAILAGFSPWPTPYNLRPENDSARDLSPEQCLKQVLTFFRALAKAPLRGTPPNLVATFLYLIRRPNVDAHAWAGEFSEMWKFKVRTYDHSWINGEIVGEPHSTLGSNSPLKFKEIDYGAGYCVSCSGIDCFISEEKNKRH